MPDKQGDRLGVLLLFNLQPCPVPTNHLWESSCLQALRSSSKSPLTPGKGQPAGWATFQQTSLVQKKVLAMPHGRGPPAMSGQGSKVEQRTLKIPPSTGFEGNPENTLSHHQVPPKNASGFPGRSNSKEFPCEAKTQVLSLDREDPLEKGMATRSSILAWRIPMERAAWWATVHGVAEGQARLHD